MMRAIKIVRFHVGVFWMNVGLYIMPSEANPRHMYNRLWRDKL